MIYIDISPHKGFFSDNLQFYRKSNRHSSNRYLQLFSTNRMLVFGERGKPEYPAKNLSFYSSIG